jgi:RimJ/RimL family protein N-acetyltransferase
MFKGEKVLLRPMKREDIARMHELSQDPELYVLNCDYPRPAPIEAAQAYYENSTKQDDNTAHFAIEVDSKYIGDILLMNLKSRNRCAELGIVIGDRAYWGRGFGREAVKLMVDYGFHYLGLHRIELFPHEKNVRAIRCYLACGFMEEGRARKALWLQGEYVDVVQMSILREEWEAMYMHVRQGIHTEFYHS